MTTPLPQPYGDILACIADTNPRSAGFEVAVGTMADRTGAAYPDDGPLMPQGLPEMARSALVMAGVSVIDRDARTMAIVTGEREMMEGKTAVLPYAGPMAGSSLLLNGALSGYDQIVESDVAEIGISGVGVGGRSWIGRFYGDMSLTDSETTRVVGNTSLTRQVVGRGLKGDVFRFAFSELIDINVGFQQQDGLAISSRAVVNLGVAQLIAQVYPPARICIPGDLSVTAPAVTADWLGRPGVTTAVAPVAQPAAESPAEPVMPTTLERRHRT